MRTVTEVVESACISVADEESTTGDGVDELIVPVC